MTLARDTAFAVLGAILVIGHALALPVLLADCTRADLSVRVHAPRVSETLDIRADVPDGAMRRATRTLDGQPVAGFGGLVVPPGLHHAAWSVRYRGGFERSAGFTQLVGPFQDAAAPPCAMRVVVGQAFLGDNRGGAPTPGTVAHVVERELERELDGFEQFPIGRFHRVSAIDVRWAKLSSVPGMSVSGVLDRAAGDGFVLATLVLHFDRARVEVALGLIPEVTGDDITIEPVVDARLRFDRRALDWAANKLHLHRYVTRIAQREVDEGLLDAVGPPPPLRLAGGRELRFAYCPHERVEFAERRWASLPIAVLYEDGEGPARPVSFGKAARSSPLAMDAPLALELELDAVNAILYELWRTGLLDDELDGVGVEQRFNTDATVRELLSLRVADLDLALPPVAYHDGERFRLGAEATLAVHDGDVATPARVWSTVGFRFVDGEPREVEAELHLDDLALTCEPEPDLLRPCYGDLVAALRDRADAIHGELTRLFTRTFNRLVLGQELGAGDQPTRFVIEHAAVRALASPPTGVLRADLYGRLR